MVASCARLAITGRIAEIKLKAALTVRPELIVLSERPSVHLVPMVSLVVMALPLALIANLVPSVMRVHPIFARNVLPAPSVLPDTATLFPGGHPSAPDVPLVLLVARELRYAWTVQVAIPVLPELRIAISVLLVLSIFRAISRVQCAALASTALLLARRAAIAVLLAISAVSELVAALAVFLVLIVVTLRSRALIAKLVRTILTRPHQNALLALQAFTVEPELVAALAVFLVLIVVNLRRRVLIAKLVRTTLTRPHQNALLALQAFTVEPELVAALLVPQVRIVARAPYHA